jgi:ABC-type sugar transport system ATPase subunit
MRDGEVVKTTPAAQLTVDSLIMQMLGDAPERSDARSSSSQAEPMLEIVGLSVPGAFEGVTFSARAGTIYALAGQIGSGASDLLRALGGLHSGAVGSMAVSGEPVALGDPSRAARSGIAFISNDRKGEGLFLERSVAANLLVTRLPFLSRFGWLSRKALQTESSRLLKASQIPPKRMSSDVGTLSGGNQQKAFLGRCLENDRNRVLVIDEPTRGVDVGGRAAIHSLLRQAADSGLTIVFASTELDEIQDLGDVIFTMNKGRVIGKHRRGTSDAVLLKEMTTNSSTSRENGKPVSRKGKKGPR